MQLPREVIVGNGIIERAAEVCRRLGFSESALIVAGSKTYNIAGKTVRALLEEKGVKVDTFLVESAAIKDVHAVEEKIKAWKPQVVFAVGGGTKSSIYQCPNDSLS